MLVVVHGEFVAYHGRFKLWWPYFSGSFEHMREPANRTRIIPNRVNALNTRFNNLHSFPDARF
jgi:hypothetical protein